MAVERTLIRVRERGYFDQLDLGLVVVRRLAWPLLAAAALGIAPFFVLNAYLLPSLNEESYFYIPVILGLELPFATAPITLVLGRRMFGERAGIGGTARTLLQTSVPMVLYQGILRGILLLFCFLGIFIIPSRLAFVNEVILLERGRWRDVFSRCSALCGDRSGDLVVRAVAQLIFLAAFTLAFSWCCAVLWEGLVSNESWQEFGEDVNATGFNPHIVQLGFWLGATFFAVARFLAYIDQRIRLEGWEVELRLRSVAAALQEREAW